MVNDLKKVPSQPIDNFEGFIDEQEGEDQAQGGNVIRGTRRIKFDNGKWFFADDETEIAADREFVAVGILRVVQKFVNGEPADKIIVEPGKKFPDIAALNVKCPEEEWSEYNGEPRGPWSGQSIVFLLEIPSLKRLSFVAPLATGGSTVAVRELAQHTTDLHRLYGANVYPKVRLSDAPWSKQYRRRRPDFVIVGEQSFGGDGAAQTLPAPANPMLPPADTKEAAKPAELVEASLKEDLQDEIPSDGSAGKSDRAYPDSRAPMKKKVVNQKRAAKQPASERARSRA